MIAIGYFAERHGKNYPAFQSTPHDIPNKNRILQYLRSGKVIAAAPGRMWDVFSDKPIPGEMLAYSDGTYYWGSEAIYYFDKYNMKLPDEFVCRILNQSST